MIGSIADFGESLVRSDEANVDPIAKTPTANKTFPLIFPEGGGGGGGVVLEELKRPNCLNEGLDLTKVLETGRVYDLTLLNNIFICILECWTKFHENL